MDQRESLLFKINQSEITGFIANNETQLDVVVQYAYNLADEAERSRTHKYSSRLNLAISILENAVKRNDGNLEYKLFLARLHLWQGNLSRVIELCNEVLKVRKFDFVALHFRGISLLQDGQYLKALKDLEYLNNIEPYHGLLAWNLANAYFHNNNIEEGWRVFNKSNEVIGINYPEIPRTLSIIRQ